MLVSRQLKSLIERFKQMYPQYNTQAGALYQCCDATAQFMKFVNDFQLAKLIVLPSGLIQETLVGATASTVNSPPTPDPSDAGKVVVLGPDGAITGSLLVHASGGGGGGGSTDFSQITGNFPSTTTLTVGLGGVLTFSNGTINANMLYGTSVSSIPPTVGQVLTAVAVGSPPVLVATWQDPTGGGTLVGARKTATHYLSGSAGPAAIQDSGLAIGGAFGATAPVAASQQAASYWYQSTGVATPGGYQSSTNNTFLPWWFDGANLSLFVDLYLVQLVTERVWVGMFDSTLSTTTIFGSDTLHANQYAAFRFSTVAGDTAWQCVTSDGTTQTVVSSGVTADTKSHRFVIICNDSVPNVQFYIDGVLVATITTHTPTTSIVGAYMVVGLTSTAAVTSKIAFTQAMIQQDY